MRKIRLGIVDDNQDFCDALEIHFKHQKDMEVVFVAENGLVALEKLETEEIDVLLLDLIMPYLDGLGVLEQLNHLELKRYPKVLMVSAVGQDNMIQKAIALGATYYLVKPFNTDILTKRIRQTMSKETGDKDSAQLRKSLIYQEVLKENDLEKEITSLILAIGIPAHIKGYHFIREAIMIAVYNMEMLYAITKELYPLIAERNDTTPSKVERAIRHAIEVAWERGETEIMISLFGGAIQHDRNKPSNAHFIAVIADKLRLERKVG
ncbi:two-component system response regulator (stage 0 sporulation protein A) [Clostridiales Family XIII bacterium PM5-7]